MMAEIVRVCRAGRGSAVRRSGGVLRAAGERRGSAVRRSGGVLRAAGERRGSDADTVWSSREGRFSFLQKYIKKNTQWVFDLAQKENAQWMLFFLKDESHAPAFESLELDVQE